MKTEPVAFMILDMDSGNAVGFYHSWEQAERALRTLADTRPEEARDLILTAYDKEGKAVSRLSGFSLLAQPSPLISSP